MQYIAAVTGQASEFQDIKYQLMQSNPVLEGKCPTPHHTHTKSVGRILDENSNQKATSKFSVPTQFNSKIRNLDNCI